MSKSKSSSQGAGVWKPQQEFLTDLYSKGQSAFESQPSLSPDQIQSQDMLSSYAGSQPLQNIIGGTQGAFQQSLNPFGSQYSAAAKNLGMSGFGGINQAMNTQGGAGATSTDFSGFGANNPRLDASVQSAMNRSNRNFNENILSGITDQAVAAGQSGSSREGVAQAIAARQANETASDMAASMYGQAYSQDMARDLKSRGMQAQQAQFGDNLGEQQRQYNLGTSLDASKYGAGTYGDAYGTNLNAMQNAISQAPTVANLGMMPSQIVGQVGAEKQAAPWQQLERYQGLIGAPTVIGGSSSQRGGTSSALGGVGSAIESGAGAAFLFSDRRLKDNITKIGELDNGLNVYSYIYKWGEKATGLMADEVEKLIPSAVLTHHSGYKMVDYSKIDMTRA